MRIFNEFVWSKKEPQNKNDIWFDGSNWKVYKGGEWQEFTINLEDAKLFADIVHNLQEFYQRKLVAGDGIVIEDDVISVEQLFQIVTVLPSKGKHNTIYLKPKATGGFEEFIWVNNAWEELGDFLPEIDLAPYLRINDSPFEKGEGRNSAVLKGEKNQALGLASSVFGRLNVAEYECCFVEGHSNTVSGHASHAEGQLNTVSGDQAHAEGYCNTVSGDQAHAEGTYNEATGIKSHVEGERTVAKNFAEHAQGKYNISNTDTIHSVGIGTSNTNRRNAHEIMRDGKHFIYGIGGYDGTNPNEAEDVVTYVKSLETRIEELEDIISQITIETND